MFKFLRKQSTVIDEKYFKLIKPTYVFIKIIPHKSIRNYNSTNIAKAITYTYRSLDKRIKFEQKKLTFQTNFKISYMIDIENNDVNFYFIVPDVFENIMIEKISEIWSDATVEKGDNIKPLSADASKYQLGYKKDDALSLNTDKKSNEPLNSILNVLEIMKDDDRVTIIYNFLPRSQFGWTKQYQDTIDKIKDHKPIDREKFSFIYIGKSILSYVIELLDTVLEVLNDFTGGTNKRGNQQSIAEALATALEQDKELSTATKKKKDLRVLGTQIVVVSSSKDKTREDNNALAVCQGYRVIDEDNEFNYKKITSNISPTVYKFKDVDVNTISTDEAQNFIQMPGRSLLEQYKINHIDTLENATPKELQDGIMSIGSTVYKGISKKTYLTNDKEFKNLTLCLIGPTRAGKTTLIANLSKDSIDNKETTIIFDFCGNCELSNEIAQTIDNNKVLNIDCADLDNMQGLGYNEIVPIGEHPFEIYRVAKTKANQLMTLVNALNDSNELQARMERYLESAALIVFISNGSIKDVFGVLQNHELRHKYIGNVPDNQESNMEEYIISLKELDEYSKATKDNPAELIGTKIANVQGILNRVNKLNQNAYMELMLKKDCDNNLNLIDEVQKSQLICIKIPETMFSTEQEKDIYCTYWLTKIWGALQVRKAKYSNVEDRVKVNLVIDELYQVPKCQEFLRSKLSQIAKFGCKPIISCHYLGQINIIRNELKAANSSYMLIAGCDKDNYHELKDELNMFGYELDDLLRLKRFHSLNLLKYEKGWWAGITKLPKPIK